jgi:hypothetical protein
MRSDFMQAISIVFLLWALTRKTLLLVDSELLSRSNTIKNFRDSEHLKERK